jgi:hypothetical protein
VVSDILTMLSLLFRISIDFFLWLKNGLAALCKIQELSTHVASFCLHNYFLLVPSIFQAACIPLALTGRDICGSAITGSGKVSLIDTHIPFGASLR